MIGMLLCRVCFEWDSVDSSSAVEHRCLDERTGRHFTATVCARCLEVGRETRVTCRTFGRRLDRRSLFASLIGGAIGLGVFAVPEDPVLGAIDAHAKAYAELDHALDRQEELERPILDRSVTYDEAGLLDDPRWVDLHAELDALHEAETLAASFFLSIEPSTATGRNARARHVAELTNRG